MLIPIPDLSKIDVLLALYDNATFDGIDCASAPSMPVLILKALMRKRGNGSREKAEALLKNQTSFDYVDLGAGERSLRINLAGFEFESSGYDRAHGEGHAAKIIYALRQASIQDICAGPNSREFAKILSFFEEIEEQANPLLWAKDLVKHQNLNSEEMEKNIEQRNSIVKPIKAAL